MTGTGIVRTRPHLQTLSPTPGVVPAAWETQNGSAPDWLSGQRAAQAWRPHWLRRRVVQLRQRRWRWRGSGRTCRWRWAGRGSGPTVGRCLRSYTAEGRGLGGGEGGGNTAPISWVCSEDNSTETQLVELVYLITAQKWNAGFALVLVTLGHQCLVRTSL